MIRFGFILITAVCFFTSNMYAETIAGWIFDDSDTLIDYQSPNNTTNLASSSGANLSFPSGYGGAGQALSYNTLNVQNSSYIQFPVDTTGYSNISFRYCGLASDTAARYWKFQYSTSGSSGPFIDFGSIVTQSSQTWTVDNSFNLAAVTSVDNNPNVVFRIVATDSDGGDSTTGNWYRVNSTSAPAATGTYRVDRVLIEMQEIFIEDVTSCGAGTQIDAIVSICTGIPVDSFGLTVTYDPSMLSFSGCSEGDLTAGWSSDILLDCSESSGTITIGGATMTHTIPIERTGSIAILHFNVTCSGCFPGDTGSFVIGNLTDDMEGWLIDNGQFTFFSACGISVPDLTGCHGTIQVPITIADNRPVDMYSLRMSYDTDMLQYAGTWTAGTLTSDWMVISCNEVAPGGEIIIVGTSQYGGTAIPPESTGTIVNVDFNITCNTCSQNQSSPVILSDLQDDLDDFTAVAGSFTYDCPSVIDAIIIGDTSAMQGQSIVIPVSFNDTPDEVDEFGLDISYCDDMMHFDSFTAGVLMSGWIIFDVNELTPGVLRIGGFNTIPIPSGSDGELVSLNFTVDCPACFSGQTCPLTVANLVDDITYWHVNEGEFTYLEATPTPTETPIPTNTPSESPTPPPIPATSPSGMGVILMIFTVVMILPVLMRRQVNSRIKE